MTVLKDNQENSKNPISEAEVEKLYELARSLNFGSITLIFQDGKLVQIEKNEKVRVK